MVGQALVKVDEHLAISLEVPHQRPFMDVGPYQGSFRQQPLDPCKLQRGGVSERWPVSDSHCDSRALLAIEQNLPPLEGVSHSGVRMIVDARICGSDYDDTPSDFLQGCA
jgi:hypothetical protein